jgi:hypothetical protein
MNWMHRIGIWLAALRNAPTVSASERTGVRAPTDPPPPRDEWQPPRRRTTDPFTDPSVPVVGHIRGGRRLTTPLSRAKASVGRAR